MRAIAIIAALVAAFVGGVIFGFLLADVRASHAQALPVAYNTTGWPCAADLPDPRHVRWTCVINEATKP